MVTTMPAGSGSSTGSHYRLDALGRGIAWEPQAGPQTWLITALADEILFGGARGGGKTYGILGDWIQHAGRYGQYARGILFRKTYPEFEEVLDQSQRIFPLLGARYKVQSKTWLFPNGAALKMRHLERDMDAAKYQGQQYTWMGFEELGNWPNSSPIDALKATLRSPHGVPVRWVATANPGGVGHNWIKARFITPVPALTTFQDPVTKAWRVFIPAKLEDNPILLTGDPGYVDRLRGVGADWLVEAWLSGNWDIVAGGMFDDLWKTDRHVIPAFEIPKTWRIDRAFDWGSTKPFSVGWWAESDGSQAPNGTIYSKGTLFRIAEWYGWNGKKPNEGLRMLAVDVARGIRDREAAMQLTGRIQAGPADAAIFATENGNNIANDMALPPGSIRWEPAEAKPGSRKTGWERMRKLMKASLLYPMEEPGLFCFDTCRQFIRTVPTLPRDPKDPDDVDCFVAGTHIATPDGSTEVQHLRVGDLVETPIGPRAVLKAGCAGHVQTYRITLSTGATLQGTGDHKIYVAGKGLVPLCHVHVGDELATQEETQWLRRKSTGALRFVDILVGAISSAARRLVASLARPSSIGWCGAPRTALSSQTVMSITSMAIQETTDLKTWNASLRRSMHDTMPKSALLTVGISGAPWKNGGEVRKDKRSYEAILRNVAQTLPSENVRALSVALLLLRDMDINGSVRQRVARWLDGKGPTPSRVRSAVSRWWLRLTGPSKPKPVVIGADGPYDDREVYYLTVEQAHLFYANGILSTNTESEDHIGDEARYRAMHRRREVKMQKFVGA